MSFDAFLETLEARGMRRVLFVNRGKRKVPSVRQASEAGGVSPPAPPIPPAQDTDRGPRDEGSGARAGLSDPIQQELGKLGFELFVGAVSVASDRWRKFQSRPRAVPPPTRTASPTAATETGVPDTEPGHPARRDEAPRVPEARAGRFREFVDPDGQSIFLEDA